MLSVYKSTLRTCGPTERARPCQKNQAINGQTHPDQGRVQKPPSPGPHKEQEPNMRVAPPTCYLNTQCVCAKAQKMPHCPRGWSSACFPRLGMAHLNSVHLSIHLLVCLSIQLYLVLCLASVVPYLCQTGHCVCNLPPGTLLTRLTT